MSVNEFQDAFENAISQTEVVALRDALRRANQSLAKAKATQEQVTEAAYNGARDAMLSLGRPAVTAAPKGRVGKGKSEVALWHLTDWQMAKITSTYNSDVARQRAHQFVDKAAKITEIQRSDHPVDECFVLLGGDMIEGLFNYPAQLAQIDATLFEQFVNTASLLDEVVRRAAGMYNKVTVIPEWGNHGRIGSKRSEVPRADNADRMTYRLAAEMGKTVKNLTWLECPEDVQRVEIGNYRALLIHGDEIGRGGYASPAGLVRHADRWASGSYPWSFRDVYVGHMHQHQEFGMANGRGRVYMSGSTESDNRYALDTMAASAVPSQRLHFINPRAGSVTSQYRIDLAD